MTRKPRLMLVDNYKEQEKGQLALRNLTRCTGQPVEMVSHGTPDLTGKLVEMKPDLVFLSGSEYLLSKPGAWEKFQEELDLVRKAPFPILGICFGHQLIGYAFGTGMRDLGQMVRRFEPVEILDHHPLFNGLPSTITVAESHRQVLDKIPDGFSCLAQSATSKIEAIHHESLPVYGLQFHPERADQDHPHGQTIIRNLVRLSVQA